MQRGKTTVNILQGKRKNGVPITALSASDYSTASLLEEAEIDIALVGDSLGMTVLGYPDTKPVTMDEMIHHAKAVSRGARKTFLVGDMPFLSYQGCAIDAIRNAGRFLKEAGMDCVKVEGGKEAIPGIEAIASAGIPVIGHISYPQTPRATKENDTIETNLKAAVEFLDLVKGIERAGCFAIVLIRVPDGIARIISERFSMITIGLGSGPWCHGQVLVAHDMLGLSTMVTPEFNKQYQTLARLVLEAFKQYQSEVVQKIFPSNEHYEHLESSFIDSLVATLDKAGFSPSRRRE